MSSGKDAARDARYGRRGGGWLPSPTPTATKLGGPVLPRPATRVALLAHMKSGHGDIVRSAPDSSETELKTWHAADHARCGADTRHTHEDQDR